MLAITYLLKTFTYFYVASEDATHGNFVNPPTEVCDYRLFDPLEGENSQLGDFVKEFVKKSGKSVDE